MKEVSHLTVRDMNRQIFWHCKRGVRRVSRAAVENIIDQCKEQETTYDIVVKVLRLCMVKVAADTIA